MRILLTGATGTLGRHLLPRLLSAGHDVHATSRNPRTSQESADPNTPGTLEWHVLDLATGAGLTEALRRADTVLHLASAPYKRGYTRQVDIGGTSRLIKAAREAGTNHLIYVSIVGIDQINWGYYQTKLAAEALVRASDLPWTILRGTQFHQLIETALTAMSRLPALIADRGITFQPVAAQDMATHLTTRLTSAPANAIEEFGGPEILTMTEAVDTWRTVRGSKKPVISVRLPGATAKGMRAGHLTTTATPTGTLTWRQYLDR